MKKIGDHRTRESWLTIVRSLKLKLSGNRRNQSRKTDYVSRFETRHDTTRSFDPRGKISAHTEGGREGSDDAKRTRTMACELFAFAYAHRQSGACIRDFPHFSLSCCGVPRRHASSVTPQNP